MKNHRVHGSWQASVLLACLMALTPKSSFSQGEFDPRVSEQEMQRRRNDQASRAFEAEGAFEARRKGQSRAISMEEQNRIAELQKNFPPNIVTPQIIYWFYYKNKGSEFISKLNEKSPSLRSYLSYVKKVQLDRYDEFDRRKLINAAIEEIKKGVSQIDYNTVYTSPISIAEMEEYSFKSHSFRLHTTGNTALIGTLPDFKLIGLNLFGTKDILYLDMNETEAEKLVKSLRGKNVSRNITAVYYFKFNPKLFTSNGGKQHLTATVFKDEIVLVEWHNNEAYFGETLGETEFGTDPWIHPELN